MSPMPAQDWCLDLRGTLGWCCLRGWPKIFFLRRIVSTSVYTEDILHIKTVNESL